MMSGLLLHEDSLLSVRTSWLALRMRVHVLVVPGRGHLVLQLPPASKHRWPLWTQTKTTFSKSAYWHSGARFKTRWPKLVMLLARGCCLSFKGLHTPELCLVFRDNARGIPVWAFNDGGYVWSVIKSDKSLQCLPVDGIKVTFLTANARLMND